MKIQCHHFPEVCCRWPS